MTQQVSLWPASAPRSVAELLTSAQAVLSRVAGARPFPLFSGGHDSLCAVYVASLSPLFDGQVYHIDTGIGAKATRAFVEAVARDFGWALRVFRSKATYERYVSRLGFPGPGTHQWVYNWLKDRCVSQMTRGVPRAALITGCRAQESTRRMGTVAPVKIGENGRKLNRLWTAPCFDWSSAEQRAFLDWHDLPRNPIKESPLGMSGECFCGAFARPAELDLIRAYAPDVAEEIDRLSELARAAGTPATWGIRPARLRGLIVAQTGPLCTSCDRKAAAAGLLFEDITDGPAQEMDKPAPPGALDPVGGRGTEGPTRDKGIF